MNQIFGVGVEINGKENLVLEFSHIENIENLKKAIQYWGGIPRWTGKTGKLVAKDNFIFVQCNFAKGSSSDPLGEGKNKNRSALHELIGFINDGISTKSKGQIIPPSGSSLIKIIAGWDIENQGWPEFMRGFEDAEIPWLDF